MWRTARHSVVIAAAATALAAGTAWAAEDNVAAVLRAIESARTLADVRAGYEKVRLTPADESRLAAALQGSALGAKLVGLIGESKARADSRLRSVRVKNPRPVLLDAGAALAALNQRAAGVFARLRGDGVAPGGREGTGATGGPWTAAMATALAAGSASNPDAPRIQMLMPRVIEVGGAFTITGLRFGAERGEILFGFREPRVWVAAPDVSHWSDSRIVGTVPAQADDYLTQGTTNPAVLWVKPLPDGTPMTGEEVQLLPIRPRIASLSSESVTPGQEIVVGGSNFGSSPGRVEFEFAGRRMTGEVGSGGWSPAAVRVRLPELDGLIAMGGRLHLATQRGRTTSHPIAFQPRFATLTFTDGEFHQYTPATFGPDGNREMSALVHYPELRYPLENQWVVESAVLERHGDGSCRYDPAPVLGGRQAPMRIVIEAEPYEVVDCVSTVTLRGPRNTPYYR